jgi:hypothetical protein
LKAKFTPDSAREAGKRSGEVRRRKATLEPEERAHEAIRGRLDKLTSELIAAALGEGDFTELKLETRVSALQRLLEWELGRPPAAKPVATTEEEPATPDTLFS